MITDSWMNDTLLQDISKEKLMFLQKLAFESNNLDPKQRMPFFLSLAAKARQANISFTTDEMERIISVLKKNASPTEVAKMDQILKVYREKGGM